MTSVGVYWNSFPSAHGVKDLLVSIFLSLFEKDPAQKLQAGLKLKVEPLIGSRVSSSWVCAHGQLWVTLSGTLSTSFEIGSLVCPELTN